MTVVISAHLHDETDIRLTIYPDGNRFVMALRGGMGMQIDVFASRTNLERLRDALTTALVDLDAQRAAAPTVVQDSAA